MFREVINKLLQDAYDPDPIPADDEPLGLDSLDLLLLVLNIEMEFKIVVPEYDGVISSKKQFVDYIETIYKETYSIAG